MKNIETNENIVVKIYVRPNLLSKTENWKRLAAEISRDDVLLTPVVGSKSNVHRDTFAKLDLRLHIYRQAKQRISKYVVLSEFLKKVF